MNDNKKLLCGRLDLFVTSDRRQYRVVTHSLTSNSGTFQGLPRVDFLNSSQIYIHCSLHNDLSLHFWVKLFYLWSIRQKTKYLLSGRDLVFPNCYFSDEKGEFENIFYVNLKRSQVKPCDYLSSFLFCAALSQHFKGFKDPWEPCLTRHFTPLKLETRPDTSTAFCCVFWNKLIRRKSPLCLKHGTNKHLALYDSPDRSNPTSKAV